MIDVKDERRKKVIDENESNESEMFFISLMINCVINIKDKMKEKVIDRNESDESESRKIQESKENKNKDDITKEHDSIATETFWSFKHIAKRVKALWV